MACMLPKICMHSELTTSDLHFNLLVNSEILASIIIKEAVAYESLLTNVSAVPISEGRSIPVLWGLSLRSKVGISIVPPPTLPILFEKVPVSSLLLGRHLVTVVSLIIFFLDACFAWVHTDFQMLALMIQF